MKLKGKKKDFRIEKKRKRKMEGAKKINMTSWAGKKQRMKK